jgi:hypothetical protein
MLIIYAIEIAPGAHIRSICGWNHRARRVPEKFQEALEESSEKAFASRLPVPC